MNSAHKKHFHWWYIPLGLVVILLVAILAFALWAHRFLPWKNMIAFTSNLRLELSESTKNYVTSGERDYSTLPEVLTMADGTPVQTVEDFAARRQEILDLFEQNVYGTLPKDGFTTSFEVLEEGSALNGAAIRRQVKISVTTDKGTSDALLLLYLPQSEKPVPVVLGLNFKGNHTVFADEAILPSYSTEADDETLMEERGIKAERWNIEQAIARGYGIATIFCDDFAPDNADTYNTRVISLFDEPEFKAVGAWAFGIMRGVDYLVQQPEVDTNRIVDIGHSRLGKAAVWAGANDERIALVISNDSGNTGATLTRSNHGETMKSINAMFPHWFCTQYKEYGAAANALPVDQHLLLACIAPRKVYVANANDDLWADPQGAWNSLLASRPAFELYGQEVISEDCLAEGETQPHAGQSVWSADMGYHKRSGWHDIQSEDWAFYLDYMDQYLAG